MSKRENYISWDEFFMAMAKLPEQRSKDPNTQVGACIVDKNNRIVSIGYNGFPNGISDDELPWEREGNFLNTKYAFVCHAEENAIMNAKRYNLDDCILYVSLFPCHECAKLIIQSGIKHIVYYDDKYADTDSTIASKLMLDMAGIKYEQFEPKNKEIVIKL